MHVTCNLIQVLVKRSINDLIWHNQFWYGLLILMVFHVSYYYNKFSSVFEDMTIKYIIHVFWFNIETSFMHGNLWLNFFLINSGLIPPVMSMLSAEQFVQKKLL